MTDPSQEYPLSSPAPGIPMLLLGLALLPGAVATIAYGATHENPVVIVLGVVMIPLAILVLRGLVLVNPNQSKVVLLFGKYKGTIRRDGFFWINPFTARLPISLRAHNFTSDTLKVNDLRGNPIEIAAVVVWRVRDTAQAAFDVEDYESYVAIQTESALRHLASEHPYDTQVDDEISLRGSADVVNHELMGELTERLRLAGIEVTEARLTHLAYAPEIASAMLQRQQADAIIAARTRIVDGAVGMVQMALAQLEGQNVVDLDEERKAAMISNLLVVLCSERGTTPVVNAGSLYR